MIIYYGINSKKPSKTNCTESAANSIPNSRVRTSIPVLPNKRSKPEAVEKKTNKLSNTNVETIPADAIPISPGFAPAIKITVAIAPGPVIIGIAKGKTEGSSAILSYV